MAFMSFSEFNRIGITQEFATATRNMLSVGLSIGFVGIVKKALKHIKMKKIERVAGNRSQQ